MFLKLLLALFFTVYSARPLDMLPMRPIRAAAQLMGMAVALMPCPDRSPALGLRSLR